MKSPPHPLVLTLLLSAGLASQLYGAAEELFADPVLARSQTFEVKQSQVDAAFIAFKSSLVARGQSIPESQRSEVESNLLQRLVVNRVLVERATPEDRVRAKETADKAIDKTIKTFPTEEKFVEQLRSAGMLKQQFIDRIQEQAICEAVIERELKPTIKISDEAVKKFYDENPAKFEVPEKVRASHVLATTIDQASKQPLSDDTRREKEALIRRVKLRADAGEDFAALVKEFSDDVASKERGGEYTFARGQMVKPFETAAFSMKTNQVSDIVESPFGYHLIKLWEKIPAQKLDFDKVKKDIHDALVQAELQDALAPYFQKLIKAAGIEFIDPKKPK